MSDSSVIKNMPTLVKGNRVRMTQRALGMNMDGPRKRRFGIVTSNYKGRLRILRDGLRGVETWCSDFWEKDE